jgi:hypothetical protein
MILKRQKASDIMYIKKNAALWQVFYNGGNVALYSSLSRARCIDFVKQNDTFILANSPKE